MSHAPRGATDASLTDQVSVAHLHWHKAVPADQQQLDAELSCPVFGKGLVANAAAGNMYLVEEI